jgi:hypothetical protein
MAKRGAELSNLNADLQSMLNAVQHELTSTAAELSAQKLRAENQALLVEQLKKELELERLRGQSHALYTHDHTATKQPQNQQQQHQQQHAQSTEEKDFRSSESVSTSANSAVMQRMQRRLEEAESHSSDLLRQ